MAVPVRPSDLRDRVRRSGLLAPGDLEPLDGLEPDELLNRLVDDRLLTPFQAEQLRRGRAESFFLTDKYKVLDFIGAGGMGKVYLCEHLILHRLVAVKLLQLAGSGSDAARSFERFYREARAVAALNDPNIIRVFDVDRVAGAPFMVMEHADGNNLHDIVTRHGPLSAARAADYIRQAALGLQHAHEVGLVHRDLKPGNLILDRAGTIKILDLGLARFHHEPHRNAGITEKYDKHVVLGTVDFMAPEQAFDPNSVDIRSDIYGLGCTFYFLVTGQVPYPDRSVPEKMFAHKSQAPAPVSEICPRMPSEVLDVLERMMSKDPAERYQTPGDLVVALAEASPEPVDPPPEAEMPAHAAGFYRLGQSPSPGIADHAAATPNPLAQSDTSRSPHPEAWPSFFASTPKPGSRSPSAGDAPSFDLILPPTPPSRRRVWLFRIGELLTFTVFAVGLSILISKMMRPAAAPPPEVPKVEALPPAVETTINGGGSTLIHPAMRQWAAAYEKAHGVRVNYQAVGSGRGLRGGLDGVYAFACTDTPLTDAQVADADADVLHVPVALAAVAVAYNLPTVKQRLNFTGPVLADIYLGKITKWNDPAIAVVNPGVVLPDLPIAVVHRGGESGTTFLFTDFLSRASGEWREKFGPAAGGKWPVGTAAAGSDAMATAISRGIGSIGYVDLSHAVENNLAVARLKNRDGKFVAPDPEGVLAAAGSTRLPADHRVSLLDATGSTAYPLSGVAWAVVDRDLSSHPVGKEVVAFLRWVVRDGQAVLPDLRYAALPADWATAIDARLADVKIPQ